MRMAFGVLLATATIPSWIWLVVILFVLFALFGNRTFAADTYATDPWPWYSSWGPLCVVLFLILLWYLFGGHH